MAKLSAVKTNSNVATNSAKDPWDEIEAAAENFDLNVHHILLVGPPGGGKTTATVTASEHFGGGFPAKERTILKDMFYVVADKGGFETIKAFGYNAPHLDISQTDPTVDEVPNILKRAWEAAKIGVEEKGVKTVVVDTISAIDNLLVVYAKRNYEKYGVWDCVLREHTRLLHKLSALDARIILVAHGKLITGDNLAAEQKAGVQQQKRATMGEVSDIEIEVSGQARGLYRKHNSLILPCMKDPLEKKKAVYNFYPSGKLSMEAKKRYWMLDNQEPANIKQLIEKIHSAQPK